MWNRHKIQEKVLKSADKHGHDNPQQLRQLVFSCGKSEDSEVFFGLFPFFYDPSLQENFVSRQELAGKVLYKVKPSCPLKIDGALYAAPGLWEASVEELPWYFCSIFGKSQVQNFITDLISGIDDTKLLKKYETMLFWVKMYGE
ncbi:hypothetical protein [Gynuella sp.]|uniref:hypothetical protein n=1 Tax=Gynuella sp. TaxID=2969146 RepID=UPI003D09C9E4